MKINLSVLAQSSPYIADVAPTPSVNRKSFAARMSMSESAQHRESGGGSHQDGSGPMGNSIILANHCAWFVVDKKPSSSDPSSASAAQKAGANGGSKDNSVLRLLSSDTVRMDIDDTQLRVGIKMIRNGM